MGPVPLGGSCESRKVRSPWNLLYLLGDQLGQKGSFRGSEESAAAGLWQVG